MYAGHFAAALAMKAREPRVPSWTLLLGVGVLDVVFGALVFLGVERATITPGVAPGFRLDFIDWSHSLVMAIVCALLYGGAVAGRSVLVGAWAAFAVFSHFLLDLVMHPHDLALWPHSAPHVGFGLWTVAPPAWWFVELVFIGACSAYYLLRARRLGSFGGRGGWAVAFVVLLHLANAPWLAPRP